MRLSGSTVTRAIAAILLVLVVSPVAAAQQVQLLLFGGRDHEVFLGCLNCSKYDQSSVWNAYGPQGSKYSAESIWNKYGTYGSKYSAESPWNKYSASAPVVVDREGNFYGYFSANKYHPKRTTIEFLVTLLDNYEWIVEHLDEVRQQMR